MWVGVKRQCRWWIKCEPQDLGFLPLPLWASPHHENECTTLNINISLIFSFLSPTYGSFGKTNWGSLPFNVLRSVKRWDHVTDQLNPFFQLSCGELESVELWTHCCRLIECSSDM